MLSVTGHYINSRPTAARQRAVVARILWNGGMVIIDCLTFMCYLILVVEAISDGAVLLVPALHLRPRQLGTRAGFDRLHQGIKAFRRSLRDVRVRPILHRTQR